jgi:hypothetical protein
MFDNTVGNISSLPVEIQEYYLEEVRQEPTGNMVEEEYVFKNEQGEDVVGVRSTLETTNVTYIVQVPKGEIQYNVETLMKRGKDVSLIQKFLGMENEGIHWKFHDDYLTWLEEEPSEAVRARNEDGTFVADDPETIEEEQWVGGITPEMASEAHTAWETRKPTKQPNKVLEDYPSYSHWLKLQGVEFEGVRCSATKEDFWGLSAIKDWIKAGNQTSWEFDNGNKLLITSTNIDAFMAVWIPFRAQFFT